MGDDAITKILQMLGDIKQELGRQGERLTHIEKQQDDAKQWRDTVFVEHAKAEERMFLNHLKRMEQIEEAFVVGPDGKRDFDGHHDDHRERKHTGETWNRRKEKIAETVLTGLAWAILVGVGLAVWETIKRQVAS